MSLIDTSINLGNIITILIVGGGIIATFVTTRADVSAVKEDLGELKSEMRRLAEVLIAVARQEERANASDQRQLMQGHRIDELNATFGRLQGGRFDQMCDQMNKLIITMQSK